MANISPINIPITFLQKGLSGLQSALVNTTKETQKLLKASEAIFPDDARGLKSTQQTIRGLDKELINIYKSAEQAGRVLGTMGKELKPSEIRSAIGSVNRELEQLAISGDKKGLSEYFLRLTGDLGRVTLQTTGLKQAFSGTTAGMKANIESTISALAGFGASSSILGKYNERLKEATTILDKTGDSKYLANINKELNDSLKNTMRVEEALTKLKALELQTPRVTRMTSTLKSAETQTASGTMSTPETTVLLKEASKLTSEITLKEKELERTRKASGVELTRTINLLKTQQVSLESSMMKKEKVATPADLSKTTKQIDDIKVKIAELSNIQAPSALSTRKVNEYGAAVKAAISTTSTLVAETAKVKFDLNNSKALANSSVAARELAHELFRVGDSTTSIRKELVVLSTDLRKISADAKHNRVDSQVANEEITVIRKKADLLQKIAVFQQKVNSAGSLLGDAGVDDITAQINALNAKLMGTNKEVSSVLVNFNSLKSSFDGKVKYDTTYDKILESYRKQKQSLEILINTKTRWATEGSLTKAQRELEDYERTISKVSKEKDAFGKEFAVDPKGAIKDAANNTRILGEDLSRSKNKAKELTADLTHISGIKWFSNIAQRALAYSSLFGGIYGVINAVKAGAQYVLEYDQAVHTLSAVLDMTSDSAKRLEGRLASLGVRFGGSLKDINEAALSLGRAGFDKAEVADATENIIKMARLTGDSFATSASALITYKEVFGDVIDSTSGLAPSVRDLGDMLAYMANQSRMSTQDIGTFSNYALAAAKSSGMTANAVSAMAISFSNAGVNASTIGTQIRRFSNVLAETSTETVNFFRQMGVSQEVMIGRMKTNSAESNKAMVEFVGKLKSLTDAEFGQITRGMDILALQSLTLLRNNADEFFNHISKLNAGVAGEIDKAIYVTESYAITWEKLGNALGVTFNNALSGLLPAATSLVNGFIGITKSISGVINNIKKDWGTFVTVFGAGISVMMLPMIKSLVVSIGATLIPMLSRFSIVFASVLTGATTLTEIFAVAMVKARVAMTALMTHPVLAILSAVAIAAGIAYMSINKVNQASGELTMQDKLDTLMTKIREAQEEFKKTTDTEVRVKLQQEIVTNQSAVEDLTRAINTNSAILDAKSSVDDAVIMAQVYATQAAGKENAKLVEVTGMKAQQAMVGAFGSIEASLKAGLKSTKSPEESQAIAKKIAEVEILKNTVQKANFSTTENQKNMQAWTGELQNLVIATRVLTGVFDDSATQAKLSPLQRGQEITSNLSELRAKSKEGQADMSDANIQRNINSLAGLVTNLEIVLGKQLTITSAGRGAEYNEKVGGVANSKHLTGEATDLYLGKSAMAAKETLAILEKNKEALKGFGEIILESNKSGDYWLHTQKGAAGATPTFKDTTTSGTLPDLASAGGADVAIVKAELLKIISPERIQYLQSLSNNLEELYNKDRDVTYEVGSAIEQLKIAIAQSSEERTKAITLAVNDALKVESLSDSGKELIKEFGDIIKNADSAAALDSGLANWYAKKDSTTGLNTADLNQIAAFEQSASRVTESIKNSLSLEKEMVSLQQLGQVKLLEAVDLSDKQFKLKQNLLRLEQESLLSQDKLTAARAGQLYATSKTTDTQKILTAQTEMEARSVNALVAAQVKLLELEKQTEIYNKSGVKNAEATNYFTEEQKKLQEEIKKSYDNQAEAQKKKLALQKQLTDEQIVEFYAVHKIKAEYSDFVNQTGLAVKNIERIAELQRLVAAGVPKEEAFNLTYNKEQASLDQMGETANKEYGTDIKGKGTSAYGAEIKGMESSSYWNFKDNQKKIDSDFANMQGANSASYDAAAAGASGIKGEMDTLDSLSTGGFDPAIDEQINAQKIQLQVEHDAKLLEMKKAQTDGIILEEQRLTAQKGLEFGLQIATTQKSMTAMSGIIEGAQALGLIKSKTAARAMQAIQVAQTVVATYQNAVLAYTRGIEIPIVGHVLGPIFAAGAIGQGMAQVAQIKAQTFHTGGYVSNDNRAGLRSDEIPAVLQTGEYVLSRNDLKAIKETSGSTGAPAGASPSNSEVVIVNSMDASVIEGYLSSREGRQIINNSIKR